MLLHTHQRNSKKKNVCKRSFDVRSTNSSPNTNNLETSSNLSYKRTISAGELPINCVMLKSAFSGFQMYVN